MSDSGSYTLPASQRDMQTEIKRLATQAASGWHKESRILSWFGLKDGMHVLEAGSGPGFITEKLLTLIPNSPLTCLDTNPDLLQQAEQYLRDNCSKPVKLVQQSIVDTSFADEQFDFVYARFLFQHLSDPAEAAKEIYRILKPGGKLVISDIDDGLFGVFEPSIPEFKSVLEAFAKSQTQRGGNRYIGRQLSGILKNHGFCNIDLEAIGSHSANSPLESFLQHLDPDRMQSLVDSKLLSEKALEAFRTALKHWASLPEAYTLWLSLMICAEKPQ